MDVHEYNLIREIIAQNEDMRVILVGDDDQSIYEFRGAASKYMHKFIEEGAERYELTENYRSKKNLVDFTNQWVAQLPNRLKRLPITAHDIHSGSIRNCQYKSANLASPLVEDIRQTDLAGSTCILTQTNPEAAQVTGLLTKYGIPNRLIQSNEGFNLYNLKELRFFTDIIVGKDDNPLVDDEIWATAKTQLQELFRGSSKLEWCQIIIQDFEQINQIRKYKSDWQTFIRESKLEDFVRIAGDVVFVSTIHKAKGKEFDNVFLLLDNFNSTKDENKRQLYVGLTRAKSTLHVHYNGNYLQGLIADRLQYSFDNSSYAAPECLTYALTHKEVYLDYFAYVQKRIVQIQSGDSLVYNADGLANKNGELVLKFSNRFKEMIGLHEKRGYAIDQAKVNFCVYWKGPDSDREVQILLPEVSFQKR